MSVVKPLKGMWNRDVQSLAAGRPPKPCTAASHVLRHNCGFLHRLDIPSSGLILLAQTFEAYYDLQLQLALGQLGRQYQALAHGLVLERLLDTRQVASKGCCRAGGRGKASSTRLEVIERLWHQSEALSHLRIDIVTGRKHQIRRGEGRKSSVEALPGVNWLMWGIASCATACALGKPVGEDGV